MTPVFCGCRSAPILTGLGKTIPIFGDIECRHRQCSISLLNLRFPAGHVAGHQLQCVFLNHQAECLEFAASCCCVRLEAAVLPQDGPYQSKGGCVRLVGRQRAVGPQQLEETVNISLFRATIYKHQHYTQHPTQSFQNTPFGQLCKSEKRRKTGAKCAVHNDENCFLFDPAWAQDVCVKRRMSLSCLLYQAVM